MKRAVGKAAMITQVAARPQQAQPRPQPRAIVIVQLLVALATLVVVKRLQASALKIPPLRFKIHHGFRGFNPSYYYRLRRYLCRLCGSLRLVRFLGRPEFLSSRGINLLEHCRLARPVRHVLEAQTAPTSTEMAAKARSSAPHTF